MMPESTTPSTGTFAGSNPMNENGTTPPIDGDAPAQEEQKQQPEADFSGADRIFYLNKPKDIRDGLAAGVGNFLKGGIGAASLILSAPVKGAMDGSANGGGALGAVKGFGIGLGVGIVSGTAMAVGGAATGVYQIGRGLYNTPASVTESAKHKEWDQERGCWYEYSLEEEANKFLHMSDDDFVAYLKANAVAAAAGAAAYPDAKGNLPGSAANAAEKEAKAPRRAAKSVADTEYYDLLGVPSNATSSEIKKAYYVKARESHPDRHPNDPDAHSKFQKIGQAYQILSDDELRAKYDASGSDGVENAPKMDSSTLFAMIFGSERFVPLVGELKLATQMQDQITKGERLRGEEEDPYQSKIDAFHQRKREIQVAKNLAQKLQPFVDNPDKDGFLKSLEEEVKELTTSPFGGTLVGTIGNVYFEHASSELSTMDSMAVGLTQAGRAMMTGFNMASESILAAFAANDVNKTQKRAIERRKSATQAAPSSSGAGVDAKDSTPTRSPTTDDKAVDSKADSKTEGKEIELTPEEEKRVQRKIEQLSGHMFAVMWYVTEMDIRSTLFSACRKVTRDYSIPEEKRVLRCLAMKFLGEFFIQHGRSTSAGLKDIKQRVTEQMQANANKKNGEDEDEDDRGHVDQKGPYGAYAPPPGANVPTPEPAPAPTPAPAAAKEPSGAAAELD